MFTLLSEQHKKYLLRKYRIRLISVVFIFCSILFLTAIALLLPSYMMLSIEQGRLTDQIKGFAVEIARQNSQNLGSNIGDVKSALPLITLENSKFYSTLDTILSGKPGGVSIRSINFRHVVGEPSIITLDGLAATRSSLVSFSKTLESEPMFTSVGLPVSNLAKESNVKYSLSVQGNF